MIARAVIRGIAATLPAGVRERYREEWLADAAGAAAAGTTQAAVVIGALGVAARIDREHPAVSGMTPSRLAFRRLRIVLAFAGTAVLLLVSGVFWGAIDARGPAAYAQLALPAQALLLAIVVCTIVALFALLGVARAAVRAAADTSASRGTRVVVLVALPVLLVALAVVAVIPVLGIVLLPPLLLAPPVLVAVKDPRRPGAPLGAGARVGIAVGAAGALLAVVAGGLLHIFVWNPSARLPGMTLDEIYAGLAAAGELPSPVFPAMWAGFWVLVALALLAVAIVRPLGLRPLFTARRLAGAGLAAVALAAGGVWIAGFGMGMGMADAFMTSGGDAAASGPVFAAIGVGYAVAALFVGLLPTRIRSSSEMQEIPPAADAG